MELQRNIERWNAHATSSAVGLQASELLVEKLLRLKHV